jgi:putative oxidoreductase
MRLIYGMGRLLLGGYFLYNGFNHLTHVDALEGYAAAKNTPSPRFDVQASGVLMLASGASLAFGIKPALGALGVIGFLAAVTPMMHDYWTQTDPEKKQTEQIHFSKNVALLGASIALLGAEFSSHDRENDRLAA